MVIMYKKLNEWRPIMINILVVDDDKLVRKGIISSMPWEKYRMKVIGEASNGKKALEVLATNKDIHLILTDLSMPVMSGLELIREVRERYPKIFIVVLTIHQDFEYIQEVLRLGSIDYISKVQLETESFDEVLGRIYYRILEEKNKSNLLFDEHSKKQNLVASNKKDQFSEEIYDSITTAVQIIHDELSHPMYALEVAKRVNMSRSYFNQCFKEIVGKPFNVYLRSIRLEKAKEYLEHSTKPIQLIAEMVGYKDEKYFSRVFREQVGLLPSEYRKSVL